MMASTTATRHGRIAAANAMLATRITSNGLMANAQNDLKLAFLKDVLTTIAHTPTVRQKVVSIASRTTPCSATTVLALTKKATSKLAQWLARCELTRLTDFGLMLAPHSALWSFRRLAGVGAKLMMRTNAHQARGHLLGTMQPTLAILTRTSVALDTSGTILHANNTHFDSNFNSNFDANNTTTQHNASYVAAFDGNNASNNAAY